MAKILVTRSTLPSIEEYETELRELWESRWLTNAGQKHKELTDNLRNYLKAGEVELFANGHLALEIALQALELEGEVITTPFTFISTTNAIVRNGLEPVFCDIDRERWTIDTDKLRKMITKKTSAILAVHVYGIPCDVEAIESIAKEYGLKVIYDSAHTFAANYKGRSISSYGDISMYSFHATKVFHTVEGGALVFNDSGLSERIRHLRDFGLCPGGEEADEVGMNAKLSEFHAAMGLCNLRHIEDSVARRKAASDRYDSHLKGVPGIEIFPDIEGLERNYSYYPVVFSGKYKRDEVLEKLAQHDIAARKYFYPLTNRFKSFAGKYDHFKTPVAEAVSNNVLCLPLYSDLDPCDVDEICNIILS